MNKAYKRLKSKDNIMLDIPYEKNRGNTCALSCYTMTARYFFPEVTFEEMAKISDWKKGYVIWGLRLFLANYCPPSLENFDLYLFRKTQ